MNTEHLIYFDNNATTPIDERVYEAMMPFFKTHFGNASSSHNFGLSIKKHIISAKEKIAHLINAKPSEITLTSGSTESINLVLKGIALSSSNTKKHIVTVKTEHKAVLDTCKFLETIGFEVDYLPVNKDGLLSIEQLQKAIRSDTLLVCVMWVNNETGVIQPIQEISEVAKFHNAFFISDATQAVGKIQINVLDYNIDAICFSAHKMYGPKGAGALYLKETTFKKNSISPIIHGGGHENGLRSGTQNVPSVIGFGSACEIAFAELDENSKIISKLRDELEIELLKIKKSYINGSRAQRLYNTTSVCLPNFDAEMYIGQNPTIAVSNGSACTAAIVEPSHVLKAMGLRDDEALGCLRISIGKYNTRNQITKMISSVHSYYKSGY